MKVQTYSSQPLKITVVKGSPKPKDDKTSYNLKCRDCGKIYLFVLSWIRSKVYQGEQVTVTYKLYTRLNIAAQMSVDKLPQYQGFWAEEIESSTEYFLFYRSC